MKQNRHWLWPFVLVIAVSCTETSGTPTSSSLKLDDVCGETLRETNFSVVPPADVEKGTTRTPAGSVQRAVDVFAWRSFASAQWPQSAEGPPAWRTWMREESIFRADSSGVSLPPKAWVGGDAAEANPCGGDRVVWKMAKVADVVDAANQPTGADDTLPVTLTSRRGDLARYEVRFNKIAYDAIVAANLWDGAKQGVIDDVELAAGSSVVKAAWIPVPPERAADFYAENLCVCDRSPTDAAAACQVKTMGLVGFHMKTKTPSAPRWIWSTFEHAANVEPLHGSAPTFFDPGCSDCAPNVQRRAGEPNQITRVVAIPHRNPDCNDPNDVSSDVVALNEAASALVRTSGPSWLANMQLIGAQWALPPTSANSPKTVFTPAPKLLGNTTLESYIQESSSCIGCHAMARTLRLDRTVDADFLFSINNAGSAPPETRVVAAPDCPSADAGTPAESAVCRGLRYASRTYELLPDFVGSKLHCGSCHLDAGRRRGAAWWAGSIPRVEPPNDVGIVGRINRCFTNSMNGKALCTADPTNTRRCTTPSAPMDDLIAYIEWITQKAKEQGIADFDDGFPPIGTAAGDAARGGETYLQKCAFCHGVNGQGRYDHGYFRPSLWGSASFNAAAGLFSNPPFLAGFVRWNMPFGSGGILTDQEAWDLEAFLHAQARPVTPPQ